MTFRIKLIKDINSDYKKVKDGINKNQKQLKELEKLNQIDKLIVFLILAEDHRFYHHPGFDFIAILRAIRNRIFYRKIEGASTIEQQLTRVLSEKYERTIDRKIREIIISTKLKRYLTKRQIAILYLSLAYYGTNRVGLKNVLKSLNLNLNRNLTNENCAEIIARLKYPEPSKKPNKKLKKIALRKQHILNLYYQNDKPYRLSKNNKSIARTY